LSLLEELAGIPHLLDLSPEALAALAAAARRAKLAGGDVLLRPGQRNASLHVVVSGYLEVRLERDSAAVSRVGPGEGVGEMSLIDGRPATAWVVAVGPCEILSVPEERLWTELMPHPGFARALLRLMSTRMRHVMERQSALDTVRKELRLAADIQLTMLPGSGDLFPERGDVECHATMDPATEVSGDFYDAFFLDERHLFFAVGDTAGKGIAAALFMARALTLLRAEALRRKPLREMLGRVNDALVLGNEQATFVALFCAVLDTVSGTLRYANGGGGAPLLRSGGRWSRLGLPRGIVVGAMPGFEFEVERGRLATGDALLLFTDGVTEARNPDGGMFGHARLASLLEDHAESDAKGIVEAVREGVRAFAAEAPPSDDLTLLVVRRVGSGAQPPAEA
jgi:phosphoserine phosphatase RsbU/P